ncbi:MAG: hypothetical protein N3E52_03410, partial [Candidatus Bathyarchaeota archaeon]|nr:hypothetical protein [Candidatus Bathyarchaeota archaeon]
MLSKTKTIALCSLLLLSLFALPCITLVQSQGQPYFKITLIVPGANPARKQWAQIIENSLDAVGIDAVRVELDWGTVYDRALTPPADMVGKTYDEGGFDALFIGYAMGIDPDPFGLYHSSQFPPSGQNYYLWNNTENDRLCELIKETVDENKRLEYVKQWQKIAYEEVPSATILYTREVVAFDPTALQKEPFLAYHYPA